MEKISLDCSIHCVRLLESHILNEWLKQHMMGVIGKTSMRTGGIFLKYGAPKQLSASNRR
jgi:hypothetical protein